MKHESIPASQDLHEQDVALTRLVLSLPPCPGIPSTDAEVEAAIEAARADVAAGRVYSGAVVQEWLETREPGTSIEEWIAAGNG